MTLAWSPNLQLAKPKHRCVKLSWWGKRRAGNQVFANFSFPHTSTQAPVSLQKHVLSRWDPWCIPSNASQHVSASGQSRLCHRRQQRGTPEKSLRHDCVSAFRELQVYMWQHTENSCLTVIVWWLCRSVLILVTRGNNLGWKLGVLICCALRPSTESTGNFKESPSKRSERDVLCIDHIR